VWRGLGTQLSIHVKLKVKIERRQFGNKNNTICEIIFGINVLGEKNSNKPYGLAMQQADKTSSKNTTPIKVKP
jgi:hypothetical protein